MEAERIEAEVRQFVEARFGAGARQVSADTHLFREGIVDSIGVLELVKFLEAQYGLTIPPEQMLLENFQSIAAMRDFVRRGV